MSTVKKVSPSKIEAKLALKRSKQFSQLSDLCLKEYNIKFLAKWSQTLSFHMWKSEHAADLCYRSDLDSQISDTTVYYENGSSYRGSLVNGLKNGKAFYHDAMARMSYAGTYLDDTRHGSGTLTSDQESHSSPEYVYDGEWAFDKREGHGQLITKHIKYSGDFRNDKYHGYGVYCDQEGTVYCGDWESGIRHGTAQVTFKNGDIFTGDFIKDKENGNGQVNYVNGAFYSGLYLDGRRNGHGRILHT